jgi:hypothetical protein
MLTRDVTQLQVTEAIARARRAKAWGEFAATFLALLPADLSPQAEWAALERLANDELEALMGPEQVAWLYGLSDDELAAFVEQHR